jgi:uncharacterized damage-inducible protein DinB
MAISQHLLGEWAEESAGTRKTLQRLPADKFDFRPHPKSGTLGWLAGHIAHLPHWGTIVCTTESLDLAAPENQQRPPQPAAAQEAVDAFDQESAQFRAALEKVSDEQMMETWTLKMGDRTLISLRRVAVLRHLVFNHSVHHRGQLTVYLRLNDVPVPALYGPSADENTF